jgi:CDP-diacylglycerol--serine O-phosphatidyltransferase
MRAAIPNTLTLANLLCGVFGIALCFENQMEWAGVLVFVAMGFDFLDGMAARLLRATGALGKQLDSLADMVSFGVLPGLIFFQLISISRGMLYVPLMERPWPELLLASSGWLITCFAALRLAKFNIDTRQTEHFIGMPTPAVAAVAAAIPIILGWQLRYNFYQPLRESTIAEVAVFQYWDRFDIGVLRFFQTDVSLIVLSVLLSLLMVAPLPIISLKFKTLRLADNRPRYTFLALAGITVLLSFWNHIYLVSFLPFIEWVSIPIIIGLLLTVSAVYYLMDKMGKKSGVNS